MTCLPKVAFAGARLEGRGWAIGSARAGYAGLCNTQPSAAIQTWNGIARGFQTVYGNSLLKSHAE